MEAIIGTKTVSVPQEVEVITLELSRDEAYSVLGLIAGSHGDGGYAAYCQLKDLLGGHGSVDESSPYTRAYCDREWK